MFHILDLCIDWGISFILLTFEISLCIWIQVFYQICGFQRFFLQKKASISKLLPVVFFFLKQSIAFGAAQFINLLFYGSWFLDFSFIYKNTSPNPRSQRFCYYYQKFYSFMFYILVYNPFKFRFCGSSSDVCVYFIFNFANECIIFQVSFVERIVLSVISYLCAHVSISWKCFRGLLLRFIFFSIYLHATICVLWFTGSQRVGQDWETELNWTELILNTFLPFYIVCLEIMHCEHAQFVLF